MGKRRPTSQLTRDSTEDDHAAGEYEENGAKPSTSAPAIPVSQRRIVRAVRPSQKYSARLETPTVSVHNNDTANNPTESGVSVIQTDPPSTSANDTKETDKKAEKKAGVSQVDSENISANAALSPEKEKPALFTGFSGFSYSSSGAPTSFASLFSGATFFPPKAEETNERHQTDAQQPPKTINGVQPSTEVPKDTNADGKTENTVNPDLSDSPTKHLETSVGDKDSMISEDSESDSPPGSQLQDKISEVASELEARNVP